VIGSLRSNCVLFQFIFVRAKISCARRVGVSAVLSQRKPSGRGTYIPGYAGEEINASLCVKDKYFSVCFEERSPERRISIRSEKSSKGTCDA
jgi:hypothetical protein